MPGAKEIQGWPVQVAMMGWEFVRKSGKIMT
jgi:hypothetical protein